jgi:hypothetical protein
MKIMIQIIKAEVSQMVELQSGNFSGEASTSPSEPDPRSVLILPQLEWIQVSASDAVDSSSGGIVKCQNEVCSGTENDRL